jgi:hypothetical protein
MTSTEFQTATDLGRVRLIKAELDALEASENVSDHPGLGTHPIQNAELQSTRRAVRVWEQRLMDSISIRKQRKSEEAAK